jgi:predicted P-loop ATPase
MTNTAASSLYKILINAGVAPGDAQALEQSYATEVDFMDGLEQVAQLLALKGQPGTAPPTGEPWKSIFISMVAELQAGSDHDSAWRTAITGLDANLQFALTAAVQVGMKHAQELEQQKSKRKLKTEHYLKELKSLGYTFKMNICDDSIEVQNGKGSERLNDGLAMFIYRLMADRGFVGREEVESCYIASAYKNRYHPIRDYLSGLKYDGGNYIEELGTYIQDAQNVFTLYLRKFLIGAVAKAFTGEQNPMLVLDGDQNLGKSTFAKWLCSGVPRYFVEAAIDPDNKDDLIKLIGKWIWEVKELGSTMRKADQEALKSFLTLEEVTVRVPYGRYPIQKPAMASFIGTVNNAGGILNDPTGSRRFNICKITRIDWNYINLDINKIWSEAVAAYLAGEKWCLTDDERKRRDEINEEYQVDDVIEGLLKKYFIIDPAQSGWWIPTSDILRVLEDPYQGGLKGTSKGNAMQLAQTMTRLGLVKTKGNNNLGQRVNGYQGIKVFP